MTGTVHGCRAPQRRARRAGRGETRKPAARTPARDDRGVIAGRHLLYVVFFLMARCALQQPLGTRRPADREMPAGDLVRSTPQTNWQVATGARWRVVAAHGENGCRCAWATQDGGEEGASGTLRSTRPRAQGRLTGFLLCGPSSSSCIGAGRRRWRQITDGRAGGRAAFGPSGTGHRSAGLHLGFA